MDRKVLRNLSYGVYVVTGKENDKKIGCIANSIIQITSNPSTIAVSINHDNYTNKVIMESKKFGVSILKETSDSKIIGTFGFKTSKDTDKFENVSFKEEDGIPVITDSCGYMICKVIDVMETETHTVFLGEVTSADGYNTENPMTYKYYHDLKMLQLMRKSRMMRKNLIKKLRSGNVRYVVMCMKEIPFQKTLYAQYVVNHIPSFMK